MNVLKKDMTTGFDNLTNRIISILCLKWKAFHTR
jgi:hypothetical protein